MQGRRRARIFLTEARRSAVCVVRATYWIDKQGNALRLPKDEISDMKTLKVIANSQ